MDNHYNQCFFEKPSEADAKRQRELTSAYSGRPLFARWPTRADAHLADVENRKAYAAHVRELDMLNKAKARKPLRKAWKRQALNRAAG